VVNLIEVFRHD
jgi:cyclin-dependent kinase-like